MNGGRRNSGFTLSLDNGPTQDPGVISEALGEYFADLSCLERYDSRFLIASGAKTDSIPKFEVPLHCISPNINNRFLLHEMNFALQKCHGKSAGPDEIGYPMLRNLPISVSLTFFDLLNDIWESGQLPEKWSRSYVVPIPKQGKAGKTPSDFRPISLTCCACKVLERMVNRRLVDWLNEHNRLDQRQHAFRSGRGTNTYFTHLGEILNTAIKNNHHVEVAALDLAKAYNRTWIPRVLKKLTDWGLAQ